MCQKKLRRAFKDVKMHKFLVCTPKSQDFAQSQKNFARSHDRMTARFRNSAAGIQTLFLQTTPAAVSLAWEPLSLTNSAKTLRFYGSMSHWRYLGYSDFSLGLGPSGQSKYLQDLPRNIFSCPEQL